MKLKVLSRSRYNGGVKAKRQYGSSTITEFWVYRPEDEDHPNRWAIVVVGGKTPGERATAAKLQGEMMVRRLLAQEGITVD